MTQCDLSLMPSAPLILRLGAERRFLASRFEDEWLSEYSSKTRIRMAEISKIIPSAVVLPQCFATILKGAFSRQSALCFRPSHLPLMNVVVECVSDMGGLRCCTVAAKIK